MPEPRKPVNEQNRDSMKGRMTSRSTGLTPKKALFVAEYLRDFNATQAYLRSGYSANGAAQAAHKLLSSADVATEVERRRSGVMAQLNRDAIASLGEVKESLSSQLRGDPIEGTIQRLERTIEGAPPIAQVDVLIEIARLKIAQSAEAGRAAVTLARLKGAFDPKRAPLPDRRAALDAFMLWLVKNTNGPTLEAEMRALGLVDDRT